MSEEPDKVANIVARANARLFEHRESVYLHTDKMFGRLMMGQWLFAIIIAAIFSPYGWQGKIRAVHVHLPVAIILGGILSSLPLLLIRYRPGWAGTRHTIAVAQMLWSALLIHLSGGRIETHFHVFGSLAFLGFYRDWKVLVTATCVVATEHFFRGLLWPESIYGIVNPEWWRFLEHVFWVIFCIYFLVGAVRQQQKEMRLISEQGAEMEALMDMNSYSATNGRSDGHEQAGHGAI